ncbi:AsnC family transcriptional regulator [Pokkaliibacter plantistimulans]|uniref:Leucine-responsive regulatory protein n=1 Tax=Pokkaliibacter plantistimulans TaxID=1635171 RepID=A0ABX5LXQ6_9GAMM|nr:winged helix-turn-helix transcriptional regulator [Pokkaliibacter plantistimulans]PXF30243.1 AsnC family transcriptional regulator [Pokkaliibacter plantistimulans]
MTSKNTERKLDRIDRHILRALQEDARLSYVELANKVGLSTTPCMERVKKLERDGVIIGYHAHLNPHHLDASLLVFVEISLTYNSPSVFEDFRREVMSLPHVMECHLVSGNFDYLVKARIGEMSAYRGLLGEILQKLPGVSHTRSYVVMEEVKESTNLHVPDGRR